MLCVSFNPVTACSLRMYRTVIKSHHIPYFIKQAFSFLDIDMQYSH